MYRIIIFILFIGINSTYSFSQSLNNLQGIYLAEQDGITHSFEFHKNKLLVKLNIYDSYKDQIIYQYRCQINEDQTLKVSLLDIRSEPLEQKDGKKKKSRSIVTHSFTLGYFWSEWRLEKFENNMLTIKSEPKSINWPFSKQWLEEYYSGFENTFILKKMNE